MPSGVRAGRRAVWSVACLALCAALWSPTASAAEPCAATDGATLSAAIIAANSAPGPDTISLKPGCLYSFSGIQNSWYGPNALPPIASTIVIEGNGATIERRPTLPLSRLFFVGADPMRNETDGYVSPGPGDLTLRNVTVRGGFAQGGSSRLGGGGAGMGGAIFSEGRLTIEGS